MILMILSKIFGILIGGLAFTFKLPQIVSMVKEKTAEGLSEISCMSEIFVDLSTALYSYKIGASLSLYSDNVIILAQTVIVLFLLYAFTSIKNLSTFGVIQRLLFTPTIITICYVCINDKVISENAWQMIASSPLIFISISKISQILKSFSMKSTGPLSSFTYILGIIAPSIRMFTLIVESGDFVLIFIQVYTITLNAVILAQISMYKKVSERNLEEIKKD